MSAESLFKRLVDIGGAGLNKAYETIAGISPNSQPTNYFNGDLTPTASVLPDPTAWEQFRLDNDIITRNVNGAGALRVNIPTNGQPERIEFNFTDTVAIGEFNEYRFGPPPPNEVWRIHGVNFFINGDADLLVRTSETTHILTTDVIGAARAQYFGEFEGLLTADGVFRAGPANVQVKAQPMPWDMMLRNLGGFQNSPFLVLRITNEEAAAALVVTTRLAITRMIRATSPEPVG